MPENLALDGRSLAPQLLGEEAGVESRHLVLQSHRGNVPVREHHFAVVGERWKLVRASGFGKPGPDPEVPFELFDRHADPAEEHDLASEHPEKVAALRAVYAAWYDDVASTRPDNWSPPRIVLDAEAEPVTTLTRQDLRFPQGESWKGVDGAWHLASPQEVERELILRFVGLTRVDRVRGRAGELAFDLELDANGARILAGRIPCPAGPFELQIQLSNEGEPVSFHQVELPAP